MVVVVVVVVEMVGVENEENGQDRHSQQIKGENGWSGVADGRADQTRQDGAEESESLTEW